MSSGGKYDCRWPIQGPGIHSEGGIRGWQVTLLNHGQPGECHVAIGVNQAQGGLSYLGWMHAGNVNQNAQDMPNPTQLTEETLCPPAKFEAKAGGSVG